ncbi:DUF58 domain-containing protein [Oceanobacter sp. 3_MG-2023]|uniref:DUF58 domain-containing protein n=1 Tax=Oceanobacter sp. 3_MG-2023 TaxID=3062622 RepID=UPI002733236C|nr:DUF58 domain-containing protein [Oceanobacter sp. 3_MG-2023]MDP2504813.1 DUF58 domain-containing protein [Oceanobacter sp. 3_MG-2023]
MSLSNGPGRWLQQHLTAQHFLWLLALASLLIAWNRGLALLYGMLALVLATLLVSWLLPWLALRQIQVSVRQIDSASAGGEVTLEYQFQLPKTRYLMLLREDLEYIDQPVTHRIPMLANGDRLRTYSHCPYRGVFPIQSVEIGCCWPFGFVSQYRQLEIPERQIIVAPQVVAVQTLPGGAGNDNALIEYQHTSQPHAQEEYCGLREYRPHDSLKHVHWSASARHQQLLVREYNSHAQPDFLLVLDNDRADDIGEAPLSTFEFAVSLAASLMEWAKHQQQPMRLLVHGNHATDIAIGGHHRGSSDYLSALAWTQADDDEPYGARVEQALMKYPNSATLITVRNLSQPAVLPDIHGGHIDILIADQSFIYPMQSWQEGWSQPSANHYQLHLHASSKLERQFRYGAF